MRKATSHRKRTRTVPANGIAGVVNEAGNVLGLMPHPERVVEPLLGGTDGLRIIHSIARHIGAVVG